MTMLPFGVPSALTNRLWISIAWAVFAPNVVAFTLVAILNVLTDNQASEQFRSDGNLASAYLLLSISHGLVFAAMSFWSERIGAGPLGGPLRASPDWIAIAAVTGPVVLTLTSGLVGTFLGGGDPAWALRDGYDPRLLSPNALSLSMVALFVFLAPIVEEIGFRGFVMGSILAKGVSPVVATLVSALLFTAIHLQYSPLGLIPVFIMGLYLGALRTISQSMAPPIVAHMSANLISVIVFAISVL
ncbi:MAG: CPBP family intramembrane glutamic endopeptidase [Pseudomonadota bacterium]